MDLSDVVECLFVKGWPKIIGTVGEGTNRAVNSQLRGDIFKSPSTNRTSVVSEVVYNCSQGVGVAMLLVRDSDLLVGLRRVMVDRKLLLSP